VERIQELKLMAVTNPVPALQLVKREKMSKRLLYLLVICIPILVSCGSGESPYIPEPTSTPTIDIGDGGLFSNKPCGPPCFFGIQPDISSYQEVNDILSTPFFRAFCKEYDISSTSGYRGFDCGDAFLINFINKSNVVSQICFYPHNPISIGQIIEKFGEPSLGEAVTQDSVSMSKMIIIFSQYRMSVTLSEVKGISYVVQPASIIRVVCYEGGNSFEELTSSMPNSQWLGYGEYIMGAGFSK
jgi:hypothetical protein